MGLPTSGDFNKWDGTKFNDTDFDQNVDKIVEILANGNYDLNVNKITASDYVGIPSDQFTTITAGENLNAGDVIRISSNQAFKADNTTEAGITAVVGVCNTTVTSGQTVKIDYGFYNSFSSLTAGTLYYVGTSGSITSTKPSLYPFEIGYAVSNTRINFEFNDTRQLSNRFSTLIAGENLSAGDVVRVSNSQAFKADNTTEAGITAVVGINLKTVTTGNAATIVFQYYEAFTNLTIGTMYYVGTSGGITSTLPTTYKQQVGIAVSSTRINFLFNSDYLSPSFVIDELILPYDPDRQFTSSSYTRLFDYETGPNYGSHCRWNRNKIGSYNVFLTFAMTGALGSPYEIAIRFKKSDNTVVFDTGDFLVGNQNVNEMTWFSRNIATGNLINLDLTTTILNGINWQTSGGYVPWEPQIRVDSPSGGAYIKYLSLVLVRSEA